MNLINGDCIEELKTFSENSIDVCITDPPYGLEFMGKEWDKLGRFDKRDKAKKSASMNRDNAPIGNSPTYVGGSAAQEWHTKWATEVYRVLKPGALLFSFGGTRTYHRMACAIEDAGFEILGYSALCYGQGFPKSFNISKGIDRMFKAKREVIGYTNRHAVYSGGTGNSFTMSLKNVNLENGKTYATAPATPEAKLWAGYGSQLKPSFEPVIIARKPGGNAEIVFGKKDRFMYGSKTSRKERNAGLEGAPKIQANLGRNGVGVGKTGGIGQPQENFHPTVKSIKIMQFLIELSNIPKGDTVLDPFMGSGTTGCACVIEGRDFIGIEKEKEYFEIAKQRIDYWQRKTEEEKQDELPRLF